MKAIRLAACSCAMAAILLACSTTTAGTIVRLETSLGPIDIQLLDQDAPGTVENFLHYVNDGLYDKSFFHRLAPGFVLQGGGFALYPDGQADIYPVQDGDRTLWMGRIPTQDPIANEFGRSNTRGTVAMAKLGGDPDSATSQFFFNLADNSSNLDNQNGGFTVFGIVLGAGMDIVDALAAQQPWDAGGIHSAFGELPLIDYESGQTLSTSHLEMINLAYMLELTAGDANRDGVVDVQDLTAYATNEGMTQDATWAHGDFNFDQAVDEQDLSDLISNWTFPEGNGTTVPEPTAAALIAAGALAMLRRRR